MKYRSLSLLVVTLVALVSIAADDHGNEVGSAIQQRRVDRMRQHPAVDHGEEAWRCCSTDTRRDREERVGVDRAQLFGGGRVRAMHT